MTAGLVQAMMPAFGQGAAIPAGDGMPPPPPVVTGTEAAQQMESAAQGKPVVIIETSQGTIRAELWPALAPKTVANFLDYAAAEFYDGLIFHRVIPNFMIQGGGFTPDMKQKPTKEQIENEASADAPNKRGTLAMARTQAIHSATSQFFINLNDNAFLNHGARDYGYCVFGEVIEGMDVVDKIARVKTGQSGGHGDVPVEPVVIERIRLVE